MSRFASRARRHSDQHFAVVAALFAIALFGFWSEHKPWGRLVTGTVIAILVAIVASNVGIIPKNAAAYSLELFLSITL